MLLYFLSRLMYASTPLLGSLFVWTAFCTDYTHQSSWGHDGYIWGMPSILLPFHHPPSQRGLPSRGSWGVPSGWAPQIFRNASKASPAICVLGCGPIVSPSERNLSPLLRSWSFWIRFSPKISLLFVLLIFHSILTRPSEPANKDVLTAWGGITALHFLNG